MKTHSAHLATTYHPTEEEIRAKAHELYVRSGWLPGRDMDNWLEAEANLLANPPREAAPGRSSHEKAAAGHARSAAH